MARRAKVKRNNQTLRIRQHWLIPFRGGNLACDAAEDGLRVFIGFNDIELTLKNYEALGQPISREEVLRRISAQFGGAHVVEMGNETQSDFLRHLDQAFVLFADGNAIVNTTEDDGVPDERRQLERYKAQLRALGYRIHELSNSADEIRGYHNSLNAVPYVDAETGKRKIIFPVFPGEIASGYDGPSASEI